MGEIFIGGSGVARGYLNRSDLTAEKFIADPFREGQPSQLYRTGDRGRYLPDGNIEYLGRLDHQVKIRGYRIEPGEIEAILTKHPAVKECIVVTCEQQSRSANELLAYVVPSKQSVISGNELRRYVKEALPEYMIPSSFVVLETLPSLANGKVDRNSLPPPDGTRFSVGRQFVPPRSEIEELIAQIWREVLGIEKVGIYDNFFELGGHSLMAAQIVAQLQEAFNKDVPVGVVFNAPTISEFAQELEKILGYGHAPELPPIVSVPRDKPLPLSLNQEHLWRLNQMMPGTHFFNMPYVYRLDGDLNIDALRKALRKIITRHESLRTVFTEVNGEPRQVIRRSVRVNIRISDMRKIAPEHRSRRAAKLVMSERSIPFDLAAGPLVRFKLLQLTDTSSLLLVTMHHIISDQWSMQVFRSELEVLYEAFFKGRLSPLAELEVQFADFAVWERSALSRGLLQRQLAYWTDQLTRLSQPLTWHGIKSKKPSKFQRSREPIEIDENGLSHLRGIAQREAVTVFMVVVTALGVFLRLKTNTTEIRIGTLVANRRRETEKTIGHFLNTVVLCLSIEPYMTCRQLLRQVRQTTLSAFRSQDLPYERLSQVLKEGEHAQPASPPPVLLSYQTARFVAAEQPYLQIVPLTWQLPASESEMTPTTFDLIITLRETSKRLAGNINHWSGIPRASLSPLNAFLNSTLRQMGDMIETRISTLMA